MKGIRNYACMVLACTLASCSSHQEEEMVPNGEIRQFTVTVKDYEGDENPSGRTVFNPVNNNSSWGANDTIGVYPEKGDQLPFIMKDGQGANSALISGGSWNLKVGENYAAYYPFNRNYYLADRQNLTFSYTGQIQTGIGEDHVVSTAHLGKYDFMVADNMQSLYNDLQFEFRHLGCIFSFKIKIPAAGTYSSLTLSSDEALFASKVKLDLSETPANLSHANQTKSITLGLKDFTTPKDDYEAIVYLMCAPCDLTGQPVQVKLKSANGYTYSSNFTFNKAYVSGKRYNFLIDNMVKENTPSIGIGGEFETSESEI